MSRKTRVRFTAAAGKGVDISDADAAVGEVLSPKTFYAVAIPKKTGTMPTVALAAGSSAYPAGYHAGNGGGLPAIDADLVAGNIKKDVVIFGVTGTLEPAHDVQDEAKTTGNVTATTRKYTELGSVPALSEIDCQVISITLTKAGVVEATGCGCIWVATGTDDVKLRLYINGVQVAESVFLLTTFTADVQIMGNRSISTSGAKTVKTTVYNYHATLARTAEVINSFVFGGSVG